MLEDKNNPLICDIETGLCNTEENHTESHLQHTALPEENPLKLIYYTDPICSSCWGIEPQLRKLKLTYGHGIEIDYRMGGLLPNWSYNSGGISKPSDVASHWDEVSLHYDMPINGDLWLEDPLSSSFPPSVAFKAAQIQDKNKAILFLRRLREMVFLKKMNITKWSHLHDAAENAGLNVDQLKTDFESNTANNLFQEDLKLGSQLGVRGFPTVFFINNNQVETAVYGARPYANYEAAILKLNPNIKAKEYSRSWEALFHIYPTLTAKEYAILSGISRQESEPFLNALVASNQLKTFDTKNGSIWYLPNVAF
ncbi:DsbA family protein [Bizionia sediminis]|uniref:DsbA family protein n=1 Tax=Bizionia sediminis TaxID=1737064 RepID=A0ABW5KXQ7_9FLAO